MNRYLPILILGALASIGWWPWDRDTRQTAKALDLRTTEELAQFVSGIVLYETPEGIVRQAIGSRQAELVLPGAGYPRIAPGGQRAAAIKDGNLVLLDLETGTTETLAPILKPRCLAWLPDGTGIAYSEGRQVKLFTLPSREIRLLPIEGPVLELDAAMNGYRFAATVKSAWGYTIRTFDLLEDRITDLAKGCSSSISPNGSMVTALDNSHRRLRLLSWDTGEELLALDAPGGMKFDNHFWVNQQDWIVSQTEEKASRILAHHIPSQKVFLISDREPAGRPDLFLKPLR